MNIYIYIYIYIYTYIYTYIYIYISLFEIKTQRLLRYTVFHVFPYTLMITSKFTTGRPEQGIKCVQS